MSRSPRSAKTYEWAALPRLFAIACAIAALMAGGFGRATVVRAQDATPMAAACVAPDLPPGTPTPRMEGSPEATTEVEADEETAAEASPAAGTAADEATTAVITAAVENYVACYNTSDPARYIALETENQLMDEYGTSNAYDAIASEQEGGGLQPAELVSVGNQLTYDDGRVSADIEVILSGHWFRHETMYFVQDGEYWKLDEEVPLTPEPEGDTAVVGVALGSPDNEYSIVPNTDAVTASPVLIFHATNGGQEAHELLVLQLPEGADPMGLLDGSVPFDQVTFIGGIFGLAPGEAQDLALVNLEPGVYTLICFFPSPDGTPHAALGMVAQFTVNAPAA